MCANRAHAARRKRKPGRKPRRETSELGRRILERLDQKGWHQSRLAKELQVTPQAVSDMLRRSYLSTPLALRLAEILGVRIEYLAPDF